MAVARVGNPIGVSCAVCDGGRAGRLTCMANPTGEQFELTRGNARAVVTEVGAGLRAFEINGIPYVDPFEATDEVPKAAGQVLLPWPNRTENACWTFEGRTQQLEVTEPARGNAIHGLVRHREWQLLEHAESSITFEIDIVDEPGWPVPLNARINYQLAPHELTITHQVRNEGESEIGFGVGMHPYFRIGDTPTDELVLTLGAARVRPFDAAYRVPFDSEQQVDGTEYDLRTGRQLSGVEWDTAFTELSAGTDGRYHHQLAEGTTTVDVWTDADFRWVQVFTPQDLNGRGRAVAVEPMTCPADALNTGDDLITIAPAETWRAQWGVRVY